MKNSNDKINNILKVVFVFTTNPSPLYSQNKIFMPLQSKNFIYGLFVVDRFFPSFGDKTTVTFSCVLSLYLLTAFQYRF